MIFTNKIADTWGSLNKAAAIMLAKDALSSSHDRFSTWTCSSGVLDVKTMVSRSNAREAKPIASIFETFSHVVSK